MYNTLFSKMAMVIPNGPSAKRARTESRGAAKTKGGPSKTFGNQSMRNSKQSFYFDPFPSQLRTKMRYVRSKQLTLPSAPSQNFAVTYFRVNGLQSPDADGTGHQPYGHDQVELLYEKYQVQNSKIVITPINSVANAIYGVCITNGFVPADYQAFPEQKRSNYGLMQGTEIKPLSKSMTWNLTKSYGTMEGGEVSSDFGSNPAEGQLFCVFAKSSLGVTANITFNISIEYNVLSYEMKDLDRSDDL